MKKWKKCGKGKNWNSVIPRMEKVWEKINARELFKMLAQSAWRSGEPGLIFLDEINRHNPTPSQGIIEATNPCGEVPLYLMNPVIWVLST